MIKFKKHYNLKIISIFITLVFCLNTLVYGVDIDAESHLRPNLLTDSKKGGQRFEDATLKVRSSHKHIHEHEEFIKIAKSLLWKYRIRIPIRASRKNFVLKKIWTYRLTDLVPKYFRLRNKKVFTIKGDCLGILFNTAQSLVEMPDFSGCDCLILKGRIDGKELLVFAHLGNLSRWVSLEKYLETWIQEETNLEIYFGVLIYQFSDKEQEKILRKMCTYFEKDFILKRKRYIYDFSDHKYTFLVNADADKIAFLTDKIVNWMDISFVSSPVKEKGDRLLKRKIGVGAVLRWIKRGEL